MLKNKGFLIVFTILIQALLIVTTNQIIFMSEDLQHIKIILPFMNIIILILTVFALLSIKKTEINIRNTIEINVLKEYLKHMEDLFNIIQCQKHEHVRHIQIIQSMIYLEEISNAKDYIDSISKDYIHPTDIVYIGHPSLTVLLNSKRKVAEMKNIDFDFAVKCDLNSIPISSSNLCSILGNLIDNAFEAVIMNKVNKQVELKIKFEKFQFVLYVSNNGPKIHQEKIENIFNPGYTTKDSSSRGYGLTLVKKIIDNYNGSIDIISDKKTVFIIYIPMKEGELYD